MNSDWMIAHEGFVLLRNPLLPQDTLDVFGPDGLAENLHALAAVLQREDVRGAIANASEGLAARAAAFDPADRSSKGLKLAYSLYKYVSRMSTRCTPFGLMATVTPMPIGSRQDLELKVPVDIHARLDNHQVGRLAEYFRSKMLAGELAGYRVRACNTLVAIGSNLHQVMRTTTKTGNAYSLVNVDATPEILTVVSLASQWRAVEDLLAASVSALECTKDEARDFIHLLLERQILRTEVELVVTSGNCFNALLAVAARIPQLSADACEFAPLAARLSSRISFDEFLRADLQAEAKAAISAVLPSDEERHWIHADAYRSDASATIAEATLEPVIEDLTRLAPYLWTENQQLADFTQAFLKRYGGAEVPLLEALDADVGIPIGPQRRVASPLLRSAIAPEQYRDTAMRWSPWDQLMLEKTLVARESGLQEIELLAEDLEKFRSFASLPSQAFDDTWSLHMSLLQQDGGDGRPRILYHGMHGSSALSVIGRFTEGDPRLLEMARKLADREQQRSPGDLAELAHAPQGRLANICTRPRLRRHEIAYGPGGSDAEGDEAIACADLRLRVEAGRLRLRSVRTGRDVHPRLASAHNTSGHNLPVYQFLAMLQRESGWFRGIQRAALFETIRFQPRIRHGSVILQLASWTINGTEIRRLTAESSTEKALSVLADFRMERGLPQHITLAEGDHVLEVDLDCPLSSLTFLAEIGDKRVCLVSESTRPVSAPVVTQHGAMMRNEFFVPLRVQGARSRLARGGAAAQGASGHVPTIDEWRARNELPLENWIYFEIYLGQGSADEFVSTHLRHVTAELRACGLLKDWFFIRYQSELGFHLRVRVRPTDEERRQELTDAMLRRFRPLQSSGLLWRVRIEGYEPEVERYGGTAALWICEELFSERSEVIADVLAQLAPLEKREEQRWLIGSVLVWDLLHIALPSMESIEAFCGRVHAGYRREMPGNDYTAKAISGNYRTHRPLLEAAILSPPPGSVLERAHATATRDWRRERWMAIRDRALPGTLDGVLASVLHMDCNRLFPFDARANEMMLFDYLNRFARSQGARVRQHAKTEDVQKAVLA